MMGSDGDGGAILTANSSRRDRFEFSIGLAVPLVPARDIAPRGRGTCVTFSSGRRELCSPGLPTPAELRAIDPYAMKDDGKPPGYANDRLLKATASCEPNPPSLQAGPTATAA